MEWTGTQVNLPAAGVGDTSGIESGLEQKRWKLYDRQPTGRGAFSWRSVDEEAKRIESEKRIITMPWQPPRGLATVDTAGGGKPRQNSLRAAP